VRRRTEPPAHIVLGRGLVLGALAGVLIAELTLLASMFAARNSAGLGYDDVFVGLLWTPFVAVIGCLLGGADALLALTAVLLLGPLRRSTLLASLVGGLAAAAVPLWLNYRAGWPRADGSLVGIAFACVAFLTAALLIWPILTGRPYLPPGLALWPPVGFDNPGRGR
jgi:hypothetical protein